MARKAVKTTAATAKSSAAVVDVRNVETSHETSFSIVIGAFPGSEARMAALWSRALGADVSFKVVTMRPDEPISEQIIDCLADTEVSDVFVYSPANTFPPKHLNVGELETPYVFINKNGVRTFNHRLPVHVDKSKVMDILAVEKPRSEEEILKDVAALVASQPVEASFHFGNIVTPVVRANPCEHVVIEAFIHKKFVCTNAVGWKAIEHLVDRLLKE